MSKINYEIVKEIGVLSTSAAPSVHSDISPKCDDGTVEFRGEGLNLISWNGRAAKYDLRDWAPEREKMGKGITLSEDEVKILKGLLGEDGGRVEDGI